MSTDRVKKLIEQCAELILESAFDEERGKAYVVPKSIADERFFGKSGLGVDSDVLPVKFIPVTNDGIPDFDALARYQFVSADLVDRCQSVLPTETEGVAVAREYFEPDNLILVRDRFSGYTPDPAQSAPSRVGQDELDRPTSHTVGPKMRWSGDKHDTLVDALRSAAAKGGGITYLESGEERFESYADLLAAAKKTLGGLQKLGLKRGDPLPLQIADRSDHFHVLWGCALGGIIPVTIAIPNRYEAENPVFQKLLGVARLLGAKHVVASASNIEPLRRLLPESMSVWDAAQLDRSDVGNEASLGPEDVLFYQLTSGSTGTPKCIPETHAAVISHIEHSTVDVGYAGEDRTLNWLPFDHVVPMLTFHLKDVYLGCHAYQAPPAEILAEPLKWLDLMEKHKINYSWSPNFGFKLVVSALRKKQSERGGASLKWDLGCLKKLMNAGEQVTQDVCDDFLRLCGLELHVMQPAFGMAEVCTCMTYANDYGTPGVSVQRILKSALPAIQLADESVPESSTLSVVDLGPPSPGVEIRISEGATDKVLSERRVGHLQIRGPCVMQGYFDNPDANSECFVGDGWFDSGDLGYVTNGRLVLTGRAKEQIIVRGANFYAYEIEDSIAELEGCVPSFIAATSVHSDLSGTEAVLVFFVPDPKVVPEISLSNLSKGLLIPKLKEVVNRIHTHVAGAFGVNPEYVVPVSESQFHKTTSGKIQRGAFRKSFLEGHYSSICSTLKRALSQQDDCAPDWFCRAIWQRREIANDSNSDNPNSNDVASTIVFQPQASDLGAKLDATSVFAHGASTPWQQLQESLRSSADKTVRIVYAWPSGRIGKADSCVYYRDLIQLGKVLDDAKARVELYVITAGAVSIGPHDRVVVEYLAQTGCLPGITKALAAELSCVERAVKIDVDTPTASDSATLARVVQNEFSSSIGSREVALRDGVRYVRRFESIGDTLASEVAAHQERQTAYFQKNAAYVVTGGLGAIGVEVVKMVLESEGTSVLILGRRSDAENKLKELGWDDTAGPSRVTYRSVDLGEDQDDLKRKVEEFLAICEKPLAGIVHLAGHYERKLVAKMTVEDFASAIQAKVHGSIHLHQVLKSCSTGDFTPSFLHFGSVSSFFSGQGLGAYSGCCGFQEGFSEFQRGDGVDSRIYVWSIWDETGIGARDKTLGFAPWVCPIEKSQGVAMLKSLLNDTQQAAVCIGVNLRHPELARLAAGTDDIGFHSLCVFFTPQQCIDITKLEGLVHKPRYVCIPEVPVTAEGSIDTDKLASSSIKALTATEQAGPRNEIEERLFAIWKEVLRIRSLGRDDIFFELGGDSLSWMEMVIRANSDLDLKMDAMQIMQHGTIAELAVHVASLASADGKAVDASGEENAKKILVVLKRGADPSQPPVFLFPTIAGTTSCYNDLLSQMDATRPMVGVLDPYLVGDRQSRLLDFDGWMEIYANAIQSMQPHGPYTLMSYSQGSTWLWGTMDHLVRRGEVVEECILIDPFFPGWDGCRVGLKWLATWVNAILKFVPKPLLRAVLPLSFKRMTGVGSPMKTERERELSIAKTYNRYTSNPENVWLYTVFMELDSGIRVFERFADLKRYPKDQYEDLVDFACRACAEKLDGRVEVQYLKDVMYVTSYAFLRASTYVPSVLPKDTSVKVIAPARRGLSLAQETELDQLVSPGRLEEINVPVEKFDRKRHVTGRLKGFYMLLELHYRCMHDKEFLAKCVAELKEAGIAR